MAEKHVKDSPWLEYLIAILVILFFGFLYFALNQGARLWPDFSGWGNKVQEAAQLTPAEILPKADNDPAATPVSVQEAMSGSEPSAQPAEASGIMKTAEPAEVPGPVLVMKPGELAADKADAAKAEAKPEMVTVQLVEPALEPVRADDPGADAEDKAIPVTSVSQAESLPAVVEKPAAEIKPAEMHAEQKQSEQSQPATEQEAPTSVSLLEAATEFERGLQQALLTGKTETALVFDRIEFDSGSATLSDSAEAQVKTTAELLQAYPGQRVVLRGHTDNTGSSDANTLLSLLRSQALRRALVGEGVKVERIGIEGVGALEPLASNDSEAGRSQNRRIELVITE